MSFIQFESGREKDAAREALRSSREQILAQAEADYHKKQRQKEQARLRGEDQWILPSVEAKLAVDKKSEKRRKKADKKKKSKKKKKHRSKSSSSSDTSEDEWVEKDQKLPETKASPVIPVVSPKPETSVTRDEWMSLPGLFPCVNFSEEREAKRKKNQEKNEKSIIDQLGQSDRELNPYWKNGGTGLPTAREKDAEKNIDIESTTNSEYTSRKKIRDESEKSPQNQDTRDKGGRSDESRYIGSKNHRSYDSHGSSRDRISMGSSRTAEKNRRRSRSRSNGREGDRKGRRSRDYKRDRSRSRSRDRMSHREKDFSPGRKLAFKKPDSDDYVTVCNTSSNSASSSRSKGWKKPSAVTSSTVKRESPPKTIPEKESSESENESDKNVESEIVMTEAEMNQLGAKIVKCEIMGDNEMAAQLKAKLDRAREARKNMPVASKDDETVIILTKTDSRGLTKPIEPRSAYQEPKGGRRKSKKITTHEAGQRVRYFADDDKFSIQDMFQQEKGQSTNDDAAAFVKAASKGMDMDEIFEDRVRVEETESKRDERERTQAIREHQKMSENLENCKFCVDSRQMLKHMIVAMGEKVYMCLPSHGSLTTGHCILAPIHHVMCQTQLDEDVWEELQTFKKAITKMFMDQDHDVVFFETFMGERNFPHMQLECVPMAKEIGDLAPIYFKKALLECETEWSTNKKVIDLTGKNVRRAVPRGLPYFAVDFGLQPGFAHVIEDQQMFPKTFAQEIIGGMLDLDRNLWRKPRRENFDQQRSKVMEFASTWKKYDITTTTNDSD